MASTSLLPWPEEGLKDHQLCYRGSWAAAPAWQPNGGYEPGGTYLREHVPQRRSDGYGGRAVAPAAPPAVGWGGQCIEGGGQCQQVAAGFGRGSTGAFSRHGGRARGGGGTARGGGGGREGLSVDEIVWRVKQLPPSKPVGALAEAALAGLDSRGCAHLFKKCAEAQMARRAQELFDWLAGLAPGHPAAALCDVYTFTAAIALCAPSHQLDRALALARQMRARGVRGNVFSYSALLNVCVKCGQLDAGLEVWGEMERNGVPLNVVACNTVIDLLGKMGRWEEALETYQRMRREGLTPVTRTYNTLMIAANNCGQWKEALGLYDELLVSGQMLNTTSYNALISAYTKAGSLPNVLETFQRMFDQGCERSVITYSSLITACEKAGKWSLALKFFRDMPRDGCRPNVVTYNSLLSALSNGGQWEMAGEIFEQMQAANCKPDFITFTALVSAYEKGGQWMRALQAFEAMTRTGCAADAIAYSAIIDALWDSGLAWAQRRAAGLFRAASAEGLLRRLPHAGADCLELSLHSLSAGVATLSLYAWLADLRARMEVEGPAALPRRLAVLTGKGKNGKEASGSVVREAVAALLRARRSPFQDLCDPVLSGRLEASGAAVAEWLASGDAAAGPEGELLAAQESPHLPPHLPPLERGGLDRGALDMASEVANEAAVAEAFAAMRFFENTHRLDLQAMGQSYMAQRGDLVASLLHTTEALGVEEEAAYDAMLLLDRAMSAPEPAAEGRLALGAAACLAAALRSSPSPPAPAVLAAATGFAEDLLAEVGAAVRASLGGDTATLSGLRCLKLYLRRLGAHRPDGSCDAEAAGEAVPLCRAALADAEFLNFRPSVLAAALLYAERRGRGALPFWPAALAQLTGHTHAATPELAAAIAAAQRLCERMGLGAPLPPPPPPHTPPPASPAPQAGWPLSPRSAPVTPHSPWPPRSPQGLPQGNAATWHALRKRLQVPNGACLPGGRPTAGAPQPQWSPRLGETRAASWDGGLDALSAQLHSCSSAPASVLAAEMERLSLLSQPSASWPGAELALAGGGGWGEALNLNTSTGPLSPPCAPLSPPGAPLSPLSPHYMGGQAL
ncbi:hypothetical protein WJX81_000257 [Elliptochloris bilobata]|uniref:Smr domain-containing protein n=1 Tax=Elliptochloris bilobata TaxID=381761 RepID=A0AAW1S9B8_9CHLO